MTRFEKNISGLMSKTSISKNVHYKVLGEGQNKLRKTISAFARFNIFTY